jgi:hypothetical protein
MGNVFSYQEAGQPFDEEGGDGREKEKLFAHATDLLVYNLRVNFIGI